MYILYSKIEKIKKKSFPKETDFLLESFVFLEKLRFLLREKFKELSYKKSLKIL